MKICIPTVDDAGLEAQVSAHFGSAPFFTLVDQETGAVETVPNANQHHAHGQCNPVGSIAGKGVGVALVGGIGQGALSRLGAEGVRVFRSGAPTVREAMASFKSGELSELGSADTCAGHGCHQ
jgi:predicted Fe-Mo cluster-binding NifX family protein